MMILYVNIARAHCGTGTAWHVQYVGTDRPFYYFMTEAEQRQAEAAAWMQLKELDARPHYRNGTLLFYLLRNTFHTYRGEANIARVRRWSEAPVRADAVSGSCVQLPPTLPLPPLQHRAPASRQRDAQRLAGYCCSPRARSVPPRHSQ